MTKLTVGLNEADATAFLAQVTSGIAQAESDATIIDSATTLAQLKPVLDHINTRQIEIMKALKFIAQWQRER